jgi:hypothetical protein
MCSLAQTIDYFTCDPYPLRSCSTLHAGHGWAGYAKRSIWYVFFWLLSTADLCVRYNCASAPHWRGLVSSYMCRVSLCFWAGTSEHEGIWDKLMMLGVRLLNIHINSTAIYSYLDYLLLQASNYWMPFRKSSWSVSQLGKESPSKLMG